jgi:hypothetical protein
MMDAEIHEREVVVRCDAEYRCVSCGFSDDVVVYGIGQGTAKAPYGFFVERAKREAESLGRQQAVRDAGTVVGIAACPRCGVRDRGAVRRFAVMRAALVAGVLALAVAVVLVLGSWLGLVLQVVVAAGALVYATVLVVQAVRDWRDSSDRLSFVDHDAGRPIRVPTPRPPLSGMPSSLMAGFAVLGLAIAVGEFRSLHGGHPLEVDCSAAAIAEIERSTWVHLAGCEVNFDGYSAQWRDNEIETLLLPVRPVESSEPVAWIDIRDREARRAFEAVDAARARGDIDGRRAATERAAALTKLRGATGITRGSDHDGLPTIDARDPQWSLALIGALGGLLLLVLSVVYWPRVTWTYREERAA